MTSNNNFFLQLINNNYTEQTSVVRQITERFLGSFSPSVALNQTDIFNLAAILSLRLGTFKKVETEDWF